MAWAGNLILHTNETGVYTDYKDRKPRRIEFQREEQSEHNLFGGTITRLAVFKTMMRDRQANWLDQLDYNFDRWDNHNDMDNLGEEYIKGLVKEIERHQHDRHIQTSQGQFYDILTKKQGD